jgi:hypothetical protein
MKDEMQQSSVEISVKPEYTAPTVRVMNEAEILSMFQVTAAGTTAWWSM